jgi:hypothetical protein
VVQKKESEVSNISYFPVASIGLIEEAPEVFQRRKETGN